MNTSDVNNIVGDLVYFRGALKKADDQLLLQDAKIKQILSNESYFKQAPGLNEVRSLFNLEKLSAEQRELISKKLSEILNDLTTKTASQIGFKTPGVLGAIAAFGTQEDLKNLRLVAQSTREPVEIQARIKNKRHINDTLRIILDALVNEPEILDKSKKLSEADSKKKAEQIQHRNTFLESIKELSLIEQNEELVRYINDDCMDCVSFNMANKDIDFIPEGIYLPNLKKIDLTNTKITLIPALILNCPKLESLIVLGSTPIKDLSQTVLNQLKKIPNVSITTKNLDKKILGEIVQSLKVGLRGFMHVGDVLQRSKAAGGATTSASGSEAGPTRYTI